jgi:hypothetical protein
MSIFKTSTWSWPMVLAILDTLQGYLGAMYPTTDAQLTLSPTPLADCAVTADGTGWDDCLWQLVDRRDGDSVPTSVYYLGILEPEETVEEYCGQACVAGISLVLPSPFPDWGRAALALDYLPWALSTAAHELGHTHGCGHSPGCGVDNESGYPTEYTVGGIGYIGWTGWDRRSPGSFVDPSSASDIMNYCDDQWVSDFTYDALADRISALSSMSIHVDPASLRTWRWLLVFDGIAKWKAPLKRPTAPGGIAEPALVLDAAGAPVANVTVYRTNLSSEKPGSIYMVPEPQAGWAAIQIGSITVAF